MFVRPHTGSIRYAALTRRLNAEKSAVLALCEPMESIEVCLPKDYEGDENVSWRSVANGEVKGARLKVGGKVMAREKVGVMMAQISAAIVEHEQVIWELEEKLSFLGVK